MTAPLDPRTGHTRQGLPVSRNRQPGADLREHVARLFVTIIDQPEGHTTSDFVLNDTPFIRVLPRGSWEAEVSPGEWRRFAGAVLFGAQARPQRVRCTGPMAVAGFAIRPGGWFGLFDEVAEVFADRLVPLAEVAPRFAADMVAACAEVDSIDATFAALEAGVRAHLRERSARLANAAMAAFELIARNDPVRRVADIADALDMDVTYFARQVRRHFGHAPKTVLRRARFLDIAAVMRGLAVPSADELAALRFYDQSHLTREFRLFTGMTPARFERSATPLLTPGLESRQQRKLDDLATLRPGERAPWLA
ncbi:AraC family transcriptional regulator [Sphingomonas gilva]|uniref:AraC family transcriptional regulator n=1 Tax=Sphingomonas gilva TaxID=2305907 RepID=A0A396RQ67_9SPHN|nr:AraC family transcriptional regulator [Sphingomonas gilva]RHW18727.1 AraC family transcriptional regulator [Sphingomonas gilva]